MCELNLHLDILTPLFCAHVCECVNVCKVVLQQLEQRVPSLPPAPLYSLEGSNQTNTASLTPGPCALIPHWTSQTRKETHKHTRTFTGTHVWHDCKHNFRAFPLRELNRLWHGASCSRPKCLRCTSLKWLHHLECAEKCQDTWHSCTCNLLDIQQSNK